MESKKDIRKHVLAKRNLISHKDWEEKSHRITQKVVTHPFFLDADEIYCYIDYKNEAGTRNIIETAWHLGKRVAVPKVTDGVMEFYYISNFAELELGYCQIPEPICQNIAQGKHVLVIVPGAVFDEKKNRIGYGKGFYDRYLANHPAYHTIAIAFELQILNKIPTDEYDVCPEVIITEEKIYV